MQQFIKHSSKISFDRPLLQEALLSTMIRIVSLKFVKQDIVEKNDEGSRSPSRKRRAKSFLEVIKIAIDFDD